MTLALVAAVPSREITRVVVELRHRVLDRTIAASSGADEAAILPGIPMEASEVPDGLLELSIATVEAHVEMRS